MFIGKPLSKVKLANVPRREGRGLKGVDNGQAGHVVPL